MLLVCHFIMCHSYNNYLNGHTKQSKHNMSHHNISYHKHVTTRENEKEKKKKKNSVAGKLASFPTTTEFRGYHVKRRPNPAQPSTHDSQNTPKYSQEEKRKKIRERKISSNVGKLPIFLDESQTTQKSTPNAQL